MNNKLKLVPRPRRYKIGGPAENNSLVIDWNKPQQTQRQQAVEQYGKQQAEYTRSKIRPGVQNHNQYEKASKKNADIAKLQRDLYYGGYYGPNVTYKQAVDGVMGKMTQEALDKRSKAEISKQSSTITGSNNSIQPLTLGQAQEIYQRGPGNEDIYPTFAYHVLAPTDSDPESTSWAVPHSEGLKNQLAAAVAYDLSSEGVKEKRENGDSMLGYSTWGKLSGQDANVNNQGNSHNAASKVMGGVTYTIEGNKVKFKDKYGFDVIRIVQPDGTVKAYKKNKAPDPYKDSPWTGLIHDIPNFSKLGIQNIAENFGTRQGKFRNNDIEMTIDEINRRNSGAKQQEPVETNYWSNYQNFK